MSTPPRKYANLLLDRVEEGVYDKDTIIRAFAGYLTEDHVEDMMRANDLLLPQDYTEDDGAREFIGDLNED